MALRITDKQGNMDAINAARTNLAMKMTSQLEYDQSGLQIP